MTQVNKPPKSQNHRTSLSFVFSKCSQSLLLAFELRPWSDPGSIFLCTNYALCSLPNLAGYQFFFFFLITSTRMMQKQLHCEFCFSYPNQPNVKVAYGTKAGCRWLNSSLAHLAHGCWILYLPTCQTTLSGKKPNKGNSLIFLLLQTQCFSHSSRPHQYSPKQSWILNSSKRKKKKALEQYDGKEYPSFLILQPL